MSIRTTITATVFAAIACTAAAEERGAVTNLPIPRFVSLKAPEGNIRRGPSRSHRIDWVFKRRNMPLIVTAEHGHWRRVQDRDGVGGWIHYALISGTRTAIVDQDMLTVHAKPDETSQIRAAVEAGVVVRLDECDATWCRINANPHRGWVVKTALWGVAEDEILK